MKHVPLLIGLFLLVLFGWMVKNVLSTSREWEWEQDTTRYFTAVEVERLIQDSTKPLKAELARVTAEGRKVAERNRRTREGLLGTVDSLSEVMRQSHTAPESLLIASRTNELLDSALGVASREIEALETIIGGQAQMFGVANLENDRLWTLIDSASSVIRRVPRPCRIPLTGLPCPKPVVGVGLTADGFRVFVGLGIGL